MRKALWFCTLALLLGGKHAQADCIPAKPVVAMSAVHVDVAPGATGSVDVTLSNIDSPGCAPREFVTQVQLDYAGQSLVGNYGIVNDPSAVTLGPGDSVSLTASVSFKPTAVPGAYTSLTFHAYPQSDDPLVFYYQSGYGRTQFYVAAGEPDVCMPEEDHDVVCKLLNCEPYRL